jgi:hypothetical protein
MWAWCTSRLGVIDVRFTTLSIDGEGVVNQLHDLSPFLRGCTALDRENCYLSLAAHGKIECIMDIEYVSDAALISGRAIIRRIQSATVTIYTPDGQIDRCLRGPNTPELYFSGLIEGRIHTSSRFLQWEVADDDSGVPTALARIRDGFRHQGLFTEHDIITLISNLKEEVRFITYRADLSEDSFIIEAKSDNLRDANTRWFQNATGKNFKEFPDRAYATWTTATYREVIALQEPQLHRVSIDVEMSAGLHSRHDYFRLILPLPPKGNGTLPLVCAMQDLQFPV